jgi:hypothetical protein
VGLNNLSGNGRLAISTLAVKRDSYIMAVGVESYSSIEDCEEMTQKAFCE